MTFSVFNPYTILYYITISELISRMGLISQLHINIVLWQSMRYTKRTFSYIRCRKPCFLSEYV